MERYGGFHEENIDVVSAILNGNGRKVGGKIVRAATRSLVIGSVEAGISLNNFVAKEAKQVFK